MERGYGAPFCLCISDQDECTDRIGQPEAPWQVKFGCSPTRTATKSERKDWVECIQVLEEPCSECRVQSYTPLVPLHSESESSFPWDRLSEGEVIRPSLVPVLSPRAQTARFIHSCLVFANLSRRISARFCS